MTALAAVAGAVTVVTGFEKGSGKTTFLNLALPYARACGPAAVFTIGVDGALKAGEGGSIQVEAGDVVMTTEALARASSARFEVLEAVPGRTALGPLFLGRALRAGAVTLVGAEHFSTLAAMVRRVREEGWAASVLVDGAVNRITQAAALGDAQFAFTARVEPANQARTAARIRALAALAALPRPTGATRPLEGPVTPETLKDLDGSPLDLSVADFTKFFLEPQELLRTLERHRWSVRRRLSLLGFAVSLRGVDREAFLRAAGPQAAPALLFDLCEAG